MNDELVCDLLTEAWSQYRVYTASYGGDVLLSDGWVALRVPLTHPWLDSRRRCPTIPTDVIDGTACYSAEQFDWPKVDLRAIWQRWDSDQQAEPLELTRWQYEHISDRYRLLHGRQDWYVKTAFTDLLGSDVRDLVADYRWGLSKAVESGVAVLARRQSDGQLITAIGIATMHAVEPRHQAGEDGE